MSYALPGFVPPMLARLDREAFDSEKHLFEVKWDGIRALSFVEGGTQRITDELADRIGDRAITGADVREVRDHGDRVSVTYRTDDTEHTVTAGAVVMATEWSHAYSREVAAFPAAWTREHKYWPTVGRIDNGFGDRNLVCTCPSVEELASADAEPAEACTAV